MAPLPRSAAHRPRGEPHALGSRVVSSGRPVPPAARRAHRRSARRSTTTTRPSCSTARRSCSRTISRCGPSGATARGAAARGLARGRSVVRARGRADSIRRIARAQSARRSRDARALGAAAPAVLYSPDCLRASRNAPRDRVRLRDAGDRALARLWRRRAPARRRRAGGALPTAAPRCCTIFRPMATSSARRFRSTRTHARERWTSLRAVLAPRATLGEVLLPNGADHHARQPPRAEPVARSRRGAAGDRRLSSSRRFRSCDRRRCHARRAVGRTSRGDGRAARLLRLHLGAAGNVRDAHSLKRRAARAERSSACGTRSHGSHWPSAHDPEARGARACGVENASALPSARHALRMLGRRSGARNGGAARRRGSAVDPAS